jgi:hypothetical protein
MAYKTSGIIEEEEASRFREIAFKSLTEQEKFTVDKYWMLEPVKIEHINGKDVAVVTIQTGTIHGAIIIYFDIITRKILGRAGQL